MPYLRLYSPELSVHRKRVIARELTDAILSVLPDQKPEWTTIHFQPYRMDDFAIGGKLMLDRGQPDYHLEFAAAGVTRDQKQRLADEFTPLLLHLFGLEPHDAARIKIRFQEYEPEDIAIGGRIPPRAISLAPAGLLLLGAAWLIARKW